MLTLPHQELIRYLDTNIKKQQYGTVNLTVLVRDGVPLINTARLVKMKRRKYKVS